VRPQKPVRRPEHVAPTVLQRPVYKREVLAYILRMQMFNELVAKDDIELAIDALQCITVVDDEVEIVWGGNAGERLFSNVVGIHFVNFAAHESCERAVAGRKLGKCVGGSHIRRHI